MNETIAFLGAGNMGEAIIQGLLMSKKVAPGQIIASDLSKKKLKLLAKKFKIKIAKDNVVAVEAADIVILAVKPQQIKDLLVELAPVIAQRQVVISIAAGVRLDFIQKKLIKKIPLVRVMPNTPALIQAGAIAFALGKWAGRKEDVFAREIFAGLGFTTRVEERFLDAVTALSGSGPAYIFYLAEILAEAGKKLELSADLSRQLTLQTIYGAAKMLMESGEEPQLLRKKVTSSGGTTEAALKVLEEKKLSEIFYFALQAAKKRSIELGKKL